MFRYSVHCLCLKAQVPLEKVRVVEQHRMIGANIQNCLGKVLEQDFFKEFTDDEMILPALSVKSWRLRSTICV